MITTLMLGGRNLSKLRARDDRACVVSSVNKWLHCWIGPWHAACGQLSGNPVLGEQMVIELARR